MVEPITNISIPAISIAVPVSFSVGSVAGWIFNEVYNQRRERRVWYSEVASVCQRIERIFDKDHGKAGKIGEAYIFPIELKDEFEEIENDLNNVINTELNVESDILENIKSIYKSLNKITNTNSFGFQSSDLLVLNKKSQKEAMDNIDEISTETKRMSQKKANSGVHIPGTKLRI